MTNDEPSTKQPGLNTTGKVLAIVGALCQMGPFIGMGKTVLSMMSAFESLGTSGPADPGTLSAPIGQALVSTAIGLLASLGGTALLLTSFFFFNYRQKWAKVLLIILGIIWLIALLGIGAQQLLLLRTNR